MVAGSSWVYPMSSALGHETAGHGGTATDEPERMATAARGQIAGEVGPELASASDQQIDDAVAVADPVVLRALLYQLTGDESLAAMHVESMPFGPVISIPRVVDPADEQRLRALANDLLQTLRDGGTPTFDGGPVDRVPQTLALAVNEDELPSADVDFWVEEFGADRWARALKWETAPPAGRLDDFSVIVIGAGMGGLGAAVQLKRAGISCTVLEKNGEVGGTWCDNRYPGARVDTLSRIYQNIFGLDFQSGYAYAPQEVNFRYFNWVADTFGVRDSIVFGTEVQSMAWDEERGEWEITATSINGTRVWRANAVISAVGFLSRPNLPNIEGMDEFDGVSVHSARWSEDIEIAGKRVAVVGTGCTGYQMIPEIVRTASHVTVFQRTPQWVFDAPNYLQPEPEQIGWLDRNLPLHANVVRFKSQWLDNPQRWSRMMDIDPDFDDPHVRSDVSKAFREDRIEFLKRKFAERPELVDKMLPEHPPMSARPVLVDSEYSIIDVLLRDNVELVTEGISRITPKGIVSADGVEHDVDVIVYATGFRASEFLFPMEVHGQGTRRVPEVWEEDGARAYVGVMMPGFPNFFMLLGPNSSPYGGGGNITSLHEIQTRFALECIEYLLANDKRAIHPTMETFRQYNRDLDEAEKHKLYSDPRVHSYFRNEYGRSATNNPFHLVEVWQRLRSVDPELFEIE